MNKIFWVLGVVLILSGCAGVKEVKKQQVSKNPLATPEQLTQQGMEQLKEGKVDLAINTFNQVISQNQKYQPAYVGLAEAYLKKKDYKKARHFASRAIYLNENDPKAYFVSGKVAMEEGKYGWAIRRFDDAISLDKNFAEAYFYKGKVYELTGKKEKAEIFYKKALEVNPNYYDAEVCWKRLQEEKRAKADKRYEKISISPSLTRAELAVIITKEINVKSGKKSLKILDIKDHWAKKKIEEVTNLGIMEVYPDRTFKPEKKITRAEFALLIQKILLKFTDEKDIATKFTGIPSPFSDLPSNHYAFNAVMIVTTRGILPAHLDGKFGPSEPVSGTDAILALRKLKKIIGGKK